MEKLAWAALLVGTLIVVLSFCIRRHVPAVLQHTPHIVITGHRGAGGLAQENTLAAIQKGIELGCDRIEIDVHQTLDSVIVLMHDEAIDRTTNGKGKIKDMTYRELQEVTMKPFPRGDTAVQKIPTLEEAIDKVNGKATLLIELKQGGDYYPHIEERVIGIIKKKKAGGWCVIHSFKDKILEKVHALDPGIPLHRLLLTGFLNNAEKDQYIKEVSVYSRLLTKSFIDKVHESGKKVNVWTVNNVEDMKYFIHLGVDGIITDFPNQAKEVLSENK